MDGDGPEERGSKDDEAQDDEPSEPKGDEPQEEELNGGAWGINYIKKTMCSEKAF